MQTQTAIPSPRLNSGACPTSAKWDSRPSTKGFVPLPRTFFDHPLWKKKRPFTPAEALLDLYRLARCLPTETLKRGEFQLSHQDFAERWHWIRGRVKRFLDAREREGLIRISYAAAGEIPVYVICEVAQFAKTPTKAAAAPPSALPPEAPKPAPVAAAAIPPNQPANEKCTPSEQRKKEPKKESICTEKRLETGESTTFKIQEAAPIQNPAVSPPALRDRQSERPFTEAERRRREYALKKFHDIVPEGAWRIRTPLSKTQVIRLRSAMNNEIIPWPQPGSWLAGQLRRPV